MLPSGPSVMEFASLIFGRENVWTMVPSVFISIISAVPVGAPPVAFAVETLNQRLPFGPEMIEPISCLGAIGSVGSPPIPDSEITPWGVIMPTLGALATVNQTLPSGPAMISFALFGVGRPNSRTLPVPLMEL